MKRRAVFMDRDGTLAHEVGYVNHVSRFRLFPWAVDSVRLLNRAGLLAGVVGDRDADLDLAWSVGARAVLVRTGYGRGELLWHAPSWPRPPDIVADHLLEAVERILSEAEGAGSPA